MSKLVVEAGKYDGQMWDMDAKMDVYEAWDPSAPRTEENFNPFERNTDGNAADASGYYPGDGPYKDPQRPDMNFAAMQAENAALDKIKANPKPGPSRAARAARSEQLLY